jgi:Ner family transcriptional regulator
MTSSTLKKQAQADWHPADIKAALAKKDYSFSRIAREYDFSRSTSNVLRMPWPKIEAIVGKILGIHPAEIWPSRYDNQGKPLRSRGPVNVPKGKYRRNG